MGLIAWIVVGALVGIIEKLRVGISFDWMPAVGLSIIGAILGGWIFSLLFGVPGAAGISSVSILMAIGGALLFVAIYGLIAQQSARRRGNRRAS